MRPRKRHILDDVDVDSCLANLHRIEAITATRRVVDLRTPVPHDEVRLPTGGPTAQPERARPAPRRRQPLSAGAREDA